MFYTLKITKVQTPILSVLAKPSHFILFLSGSPLLFVVMTAGGAVGQNPGDSGCYYTRKNQGVRSNNKQPQQRVDATENTGKVSHLLRTNTLLVCTLLNVLNDAHGPERVRATCCLAIDFT